MGLQGRLGFFFWYGDVNSDFGEKGNLADSTMLKFAVIGVNPSTMSPSQPMYKHYTYLPKEENVDDGGFIKVVAMVLMLICLDF